MNQRQDSLQSQMETVQQSAVKNGCYDAADWIHQAWSAQHSHQDERPDLPPLDDAIATAITKAHEKNLSGGHREGFCQACAECYRVACATVIASRDLASSTTPPERDR